MGAWEPHSAITREHIDPAPVAALSALFDDDLPVARDGDPLPPLWHWAALPRWAPSSQLAADGHPFRGSFLPPVDLPRRMFAGGSVEFLAPLRVGDTTSRTARVVSVEEKTGKSGRLVLVAVNVVLAARDGRPAVRERQNLVYREASPGGTPTAAAPDASPVGAPLVSATDGRWTFHTDPTLLMRFSAATANAHRIHYDWNYATGVEGYPGLVVHGPLMTLALLEAHRRSGDHRRITRMAHRNSAPLFCGEEAWVETADDESGGRTVSLFGPHGRDAGPRTSIELAFD